LARIHHCSKASLHLLIRRIKPFTVIQKITYQAQTALSWSHFCIKPRVTVMA
jgi:hypothetical protein